MAASRKPLVEGISKLFNSPEHADTKIYIGSFELPAHELVLAVQSPFFKKALGGSFQESKTKQFHFAEGSAHAHWRVFEYMYTGNYSEEPNEVLGVEDDGELVKDVRVYLTADFFLMDELKAYALKRFQPKLQRLWISELLVDCIKEVYSFTDDSGKDLRDAVVEVAKEHFRELWDKIAFQALVRDVGDFAVDLMARFYTV
ncbi:BTB/POZ domain-containing protein [Hypoxylon fuscum]|nr:BTB/POZ domain-containing protein [Hypoxylon fuscum]